MKKFKAFCRSFHKNVVVMGKWRAFFFVTFTKEGRSSINKLFELTKNCRTNTIESIHWSRIIPGHRIIYTKYAKGLEDHELYLDIPMIRVVKNHRYYVVVDGNHRLPAFIKRAKRTNDLIKCEVMK